MTGPAAPVQANLGYFQPFMTAWGTATPDTRATVYSETLDYRAGLIDAATEVRQVSGTLGIATPAGY